MQMRKYKLGDIATVEISGVDKKIKDGEEDIRLCNFVDVYYNWAITMARHDSFMLATARPNEISKFQLKKGQVALTKDSETRDDIGISTYIADDFNDVILGYHCALITPNKDILDGRYLNALMHTGYAKKYFAFNASGSGQRYALSAETLNSFPVPVIPLQKQKQIGEIFSALDKKIELNKQINQNLEAMAKQLYDYWFVQFDFPNEEGKPYKSSGGEMVWNDKLKREIPKNWCVLQLDKLCSFRNGINYTKDEIGEPFPIVNVRNISSSTILLDGEDFDVITIPVKKAENYILTDKDIIIARSGCPGSTRLLQDSQKTLFCGFIICCTPYDGYKRYFLTYVLKGLEGSSATTSGGSILQNVSQDTLKSLWVTVPRIDLLIRFNEIIDNLLKQMCVSLRISKELIKQRDELLPILMNGQVLVNSDLAVFYIIYGLKY